MRSKKSNRRKINRRKKSMKSRKLRKRGGSSSAGGSGLVPPMPPGLATASLSGGGAAVYYEFLHTGMTGIGGTAAGARDEFEPPIYYQLPVGTPAAADITLKINLLDICSGKGQTVDDPIETQVVIV